MSRKLIGILFSLVCSFLFAASASAVELSQCDGPQTEAPHFSFVAQTDVILEPVGSLQKSN